MLQEPDFSTVILLFTVKKKRRKKKEIKNLTKSDIAHMLCMDAHFHPKSHVKKSKVV